MKNKLSQTNLRMKRIIILFFFSAIFTGLAAQQSRIENTWFWLSSTTDSLIIKYDLTGNQNAFNVTLEVSKKTGQNVKLKNVFGDIGNDIRPGKNKTIIWNMKNDNADVYGSKLLVKVTGRVFVAEIIEKETWVHRLKKVTESVFLPEKVKKETWMPWLYIAAGVSATTGIYSHIRANQLYNSYPLSAVTDDAEQIRNDTNRKLVMRNVAFSAAGAFGAAGVVVHIKHNQKKKALEISYSPLPDGGAFGFTCKF